MHSRAARFPVNAGRCEFVSPNRYYPEVRDRNFYRQNPVPFLVSDVRIANTGRSALEISPDKYYPQNRKRRVTLGNSPQYTATRGPAALQSLPQSRPADGKFTGADHCQVFADGFAFNNCSPAADVKRFRVGDGRKEKLQRLRKPRLLPCKWKSCTSATPAIRDCCFQIGFISIGSTAPAPVHTPLHPTLQRTADVILGRLKAASVKKTVTRAAKDPGPGPGSYNIPSYFDHVHVDQLCIPKKRWEPKSGLRYLDSLVAKTREENFPGPEKYTGLKSPFDTIAERSNRRPIRSNAVVSKRLPDVQKPAPNSYNTQCQLLYNSNPKWSIKGSERSTSLANVNTPVHIGPMTYNVKNGDIGYKIVLRHESDRRHMVTKRPFDTTSSARPITPTESAFRKKPHLPNLT